MSQKQVRSVAIIGSGPSGCTLGSLLARAGLKVIIFTAGKRPPLLVGESLVPAIVPILRDLGIEEEVKGYSTYKPGATFFPTDCEELTYPFQNIKSTLPKYAYNVPRDKFDVTLCEAAARHGARTVTHTAGFAKGDGGRDVVLDDATMSATEGFLDSQPDLIVDASGRARLLAKFLDIPAQEGNRKDVALFAHLDDVPVPCPGNIHIDRLQYGWAWRIPLPGRMSLGIVIQPDHLKKFGDNIEEQYDAYLKSEPTLAKLTANARRLTGVMRYNNYQLVSERMTGPGWVMVGDAAGFIDPIFSSGLFIAMDGAQKLADAILHKGTTGLPAYEAYLKDHLASWHRIVGYFYSGRMLTLLRYGREMRTTPVGRIVEPHMQKHMGRIFTGAAGKARYSKRLLDFMATYGISQRDHRLLRIC